MELKSLMVTSWDSVLMFRKYNNFVVRYELGAYYEHLKDAIATIRRLNNSDESLDVYLVICARDISEDKKIMYSTLTLYRDNYDYYVNEKDNEEVIRKLKERGTKIAV